MTDESSLSSLESYPGYFTGKPPFFRRKNVHVVGTALAGLVVGIGLGGGGTATSAPQGPSVHEIQAGIDHAVRTKLAAAVDDAVARERAAGEQDLSDAEARLQRAERQASAVQHRARVAQQQARVAQRRAVAAAVERTRRQVRHQLAVARAESAPAPAPAAPAPAAATTTDPRFAYCYEANAAGYGPYTQGVDPEYDWYRDADGDGVVCEP